MNTQREMFEAWYGKHCEPGVAPWFVREDDNSDEYFMSHTQTAWNAWQAAVAAQESSKLSWQPIDTAPKDGRFLLLGYKNKHGAWHSMRGSWFSQEEIDATWEEGDLFQAGWYEAAVEDELCWPTKPTHWMPLPQEPNK